MKKLLQVLFIVGLSACSGSDEPKGDIYTIDGVAIGGFDLVSYFEQGEALHGTLDQKSIYNEATYYFANAKNKTLFDANPEKYLPAYGGWCAYAVAENSIKMEPDPTLWKIQDGRLLLFYSDWLTPITGKLSDAWNENEKENLVKADRNWENIKSQKAQ